MNAVIRFIFVLATGLVLSTTAAAESAAQQPLAERDVYNEVCIACHGPDGRGIEPTILGLERPMPDFSDCSFATVEPDADWLAVAHGGGPSRGFDPRMPAFAGVLTIEELQNALDYIRGFCQQPGWPRGELNLPRALVTEKAFPENEFVWTVEAATTGAGSVVNELLYEQRLGVRSQVEIVAPLEMAEGPAGAWARGLGDIAVALKHAVYHDLGRGHILSVAGEVILPTGDEERGLGKGVTVFEPFVAFGQILPANTFLHAQAGVELPADTDRVPREAFWRAALGRTFTEGTFGRAWSPMVEVLTARVMQRGARLEWDVVPQVQFTLNRRQHIMANVGVRIPVNERSGRHAQLITYFLWDWFDGGLLEGW